MFVSSFVKYSDENASERKVRLHVSLSKEVSIFTPSPTHSSVSVEFIYTHAFIFPANSKGYTQKKPKSLHPCFLLGLSASDNGTKKH